MTAPGTQWLPEPSRSQASRARTNRARCRTTLRAALRATPNGPICARSGNGIRPRREANIRRYTGDLVAPVSGVAVIFEAKVLSDISTHVTFDPARNQLARSIDVMLEANPTLPAPVSRRKPERTFLVLLTPALMQPGRTGDALSKSRLYGWLMPAYKDPNSSLLRQHLPHRDSNQLAESAERLGWASWEDCRAVIPDACPWLTASQGTG